MQTDLVHCDRRSGHEGKDPEAKDHSHPLNHQAAHTDDVSGTGSFEESPARTIKDAKNWLDTGSSKQALHGLVMRSPQIPQNPSQLLLQPSPSIYMSQDSSRMQGLLQARTLNEKMNLHEQALEGLTRQQRRQLHQQNLE